MAEKDLSEKLLMNYNDVFADIVNGLLFKGAEIVEPSSLEDRAVHFQYKADGKLHEEERDIYKAWKQCGIEIALCGLENQTKPFEFMPARVIGYDGASYRAQLLNENVKGIVPVITIVLYFGNAHWNKPKTLKELFGDYPEELDEYVNDYKIHVFEIAWLTDEEIERFKGDFKVVANFFSQRRRNKNYQPDDPQTIEHVDEVLKLLSVMTGDNRYEDILSVTAERRIANMCDVAERLENKGIAIGRAEGRAESKAEYYKIVTANYMKLNPGCTLEEAQANARALLGIKDH